MSAVDKRVDANRDLASAIERRDWPHIEAIALGHLREATFNDATASAWAMVAIVAVTQGQRATKRGGQ